MQLCTPTAMHAARATPSPEPQHITTCCCGLSETNSGWWGAWGRGARPIRDRQTRMANRSDSRYPTRWSLDQCVMRVLHQRLYPVCSRCVHTRPAPMPSHFIAAMSHMLLSVFLGLANKRARELEVRTQPQSAAQRGVEVQLLWSRHACSSRSSPVALRFSCKSERPNTHRHGRRQSCSIADCARFSTRLAFPTACKWQPSLPCKILLVIWYCSASSLPFNRSQSLQSG